MSGALRGTCLLPGLVGRSESFVRMVERLQRLARFDVPVLLIGETGTGKELAARAVHYGSSRSGGPFIPLNCGALPENLVETELFGCERGAYTDARHGRRGLVAAAGAGTLFLDEIDSLPARAQVSLLRFLQDKAFRPVGSTREQRSDVRVIAAASPRLRELVRCGSFRADLAFRLNVMPVELPPLRERRGDVALLSEHFVALYARQYDLAPRPVDACSREWAEHYAWPGNVRELDNVVHRALLLSDGQQLDLVTHLASLDAAAPPRPAGVPPALVSYREARDRALHDFERRYLTGLMAAAVGNVTHAARLAGKERRALGRLLKKHGLERAPTSAGAPE